MGATFHCPPPEIAHDHLVAFDVLETASQDVFTDADAQQPGGDEHPQLQGDVVFQDGTWSSAQPVVDDSDKAKQWEVVRDAWKTPQIVVDAQGDGLVKDVLDAAAAIWSDAFGWSFGADGDNELKNEVTGLDGAEAIVWDTFEDIYMAAPLVTATA